LYARMGNLEVVIALGYSEALCRPVPVTTLK
jgi:hypothetical protein